MPSLSNCVQVTVLKQVTAEKLPQVMEGGTGAMACSFPLVQGLGIYRFTLCVNSSAVLLTCLPLLLFPPLEEGEQPVKGQHTVGESVSPGRGSPNLALHQHRWWCGIPLRIWAVSSSLIFFSSIFLYEDHFQSEYVALSHCADLIWYLLTQ